MCGEDSVEGGTGGAPFSVTMLCRELMKREPRRLTDLDTIRKAAQVMRDAGVGFLPIVDSAGRPVGVVTDRDLVVRALANDVLAEAAISTVMTDEVLAVHEGDDLRTAANRMARTHRARVVVLDDAGVLVGVLSLSDVIDHLEAASATWTMREVVQRAERLSLIPGGDARSERASLPGRPSRAA